MSHFENLNKESIEEDLESILSYLNEKVDYLLLTDLYRNISGEEFNIADENTFIKEYLIEYFDKNFFNPM